MTITAPPADTLEVTPLVGKHETNRKQLAALGWRFTLPAIVVVAAVTIFPILFSIVMSFTHVAVTSHGFSLSDWFTLKDYSIVIHSAEWRYAVGFTIFFTIVTVVIEVILGTIVALVLERLTAGRGWMMAILLIPWSLITVISAQLWSYIYNPTYGAADAIFRDLGWHSPPVILGTQVPAIIALIVADVWKTTPFVAIMVLAGLVMLPTELYEAAEVDGAAGWTTFWRITFPLLRPTIALSVLFRVLQAFGLFDLPFVLTQGGPGYKTTSLAILGYNAMFKDLEFGPGAAVATTTALLVLIGCALALKVFRQQVGEDL